MTESAEVDYRETQFGIRVGETIQPVAVGPAEAERYRQAGVEVYRRERTTYIPDVTEWRELPATNPTPNRETQ